MPLTINPAAFVLAVEQVSRGVSGHAALYTRVFATGNDVFHLVKCQSRHLRFCSLLFHSLLGDGS